MSGHGFRWRHRGNYLLDKALPVGVCPGLQVAAQGKRRVMEPRPKLNFFRTSTQNMSCLGNVMSISCHFYEMPCLLNAISKFWEVSFICNVHQMSVIYRKCHENGVSCLWNVMYMKCLSMKWHVYEMAWLWNAMPMKWHVYVMSWLCNVMSTICHVYEMSSLWNVIPLKCHIYKMSWL